MTAFDRAWSVLKDEASRDNPTGNPSIQRLIDKVRGKKPEQPEVEIEHRPKTGNPSIDRLLDKVREQKDEGMREVGRSGKVAEADHPDHAQGSFPEQARSDDL